MAIRTKTDVVYVAPDGTLQVPQDVLEDAGFAPGDEVFFWTHGDKRLHLRAVPTFSPQELFEMYGDPSITELDWPKVREEAEQFAADELIAKIQR